jgi:uncharacterized protein
LVKLVIEEPESEALRRHLAEPTDIATSRIALVEVTRAARIADPSIETFANVRSLFQDCLLLDVGDVVVSAAARLVSRQLRTLDSIHLASAQIADPAEMIVYNERLRTASEEAGFVVVSPGA